MFASSSPVLGSYSSIPQVLTNMADAIYKVIGLTKKKTKTGETGDRSPLSSRRPANEVKKNNRDNQTTY
jgi:hypothetical protein